MNLNLFAMKKEFLVAAFTIIFIKAGSQELKAVSYKDGDQKLNGLVTNNAGKKLPGVLVLPAWKGIDEEARNSAIELSKKGYIAFVADIYGEGNIPPDNAAAAKLLVLIEKIMRPIKGELNWLCNN